MIEMPPYRELLRRNLFTLAVAAGLVALAYFWIDRPVAEFVQREGINRSDTLQRITDFPMWLNALAPAIALYSVVRLAIAPLSRMERAGLAAAVSLMVAVAFEYYLKFLAGRYWPETWVNHNPSLIGTGDYGFHPFHFGEWYGSFPSGHTLRTASFAGVFAIAYPRFRWLCIAATLMVMLALVGMNYHFVGDTVGGAAVGIVIARYAAAFFDLGRIAAVTPSSAGRSAC